MNGYVVDLVREDGENMIVAWSRVEAGIVESVEVLPLHDGEGALFTPDYLREVFDTDASAADLMLGDWSGEAGDQQYIGQPVAAVMAANDTENLIKRRVVSL